MRRNVASPSFVGEGLMPEIIMRQENSDNEYLGYFQNDLYIGTTWYLLIVLKINISHRDCSVLLLTHSSPFNSST